MILNGETADLHNPISGYPVFGHLPIDGRSHETCPQFDHESRGMALRKSINQSAWVYICIYPTNIFQDIEKNWLMIWQISAGD